MKRPYLKERRLSDVLALIQVLSLDEHAHRSEAGLKEELQGSPASADFWREVALEHPEFFRVRASGEHVVSLTARHVIPKTPAGRPPLPADFTHQLLRTALELHDRQVDAAVRWRTLLPLFVALITGLFSLGAVYFGWHLGQAGSQQIQKSGVVVAPAAKP
ncbi:MAG: hypothetical protein LAO77_17045 [Acidobacteriia bacterium]|nr:hypothetical protein [Terriglobia bacterium]